MAAPHHDRDAPPEPRRAPPRPQPRRRHPGRDPAPAGRRRLRRADHGRRRLRGRRRQGDDLPPLAHQAGPRRRHHLRPQPRRGRAPGHRIARGRPPRRCCTQMVALDQRPDGRRDAVAALDDAAPAGARRGLPQRPAGRLAAGLRADLGARRGARRGAAGPRPARSSRRRTSALLVQRWLLTGEPVDEAYADEVLDTVVLPLSACGPDRPPDARSRAGRALGVTSRGCRARP